MSKHRHHHPTHAVHQPHRQERTSYSSTQDTRPKREKQPSDEQLNAVNNPSGEGTRNDDERVVSLRQEPSENMPSLFNWPSMAFDLFLAPWRNMTAFASSMGDWSNLGRSLSPKTETTETENDYIYKVELPGVTKDQVALNFQNGAIMLRVEEAEDKRSDEVQYHRSRSLRRAFTLPVYTNGEAITSELKDGVLTITVPKTDRPIAPQSRMIEVA